MEQGYNVGSAIALGTSLQPDKTQPLTRGTGQWLQAEMNREAKRLKAEQQKQKDLEQIGTSLKGSGSMYQDINEAMKNTLQEGYYGMWQNLNDPYKKNLIQMETQQRVSQLQKEDQQRTRELQRAYNTVAGKDLSPYLQSGGLGAVMKYVTENKDYADQINVYGDEYEIDSPKAVNIGNMMRGLMLKERNRLPVELTGQWATWYDNKVSNTAKFKDDDIRQFAAEMSNDKQLRDNYYFQNRQKLKPFFEEEFNRLASDPEVLKSVGDNLTAISTLAKTNVVNREMYGDFQKMNSMQARSSEGRNFNITFGGTDPDKKKVVIFKQVTGNDAVNFFNSPIFKNIKVSDAFTQKFTNSTPLDYMNAVDNSSSPIVQYDEALLSNFGSSGNRTANVLLGVTDENGKPLREQISGSSVQEIVFYKRQDGTEGAFAIIGKSDAKGIASGSFAVPLKGNMEALAQIVGGVLPEDLVDKIKPYLEDMGYSDSVIPSYGGGAYTDTKTKKVVTKKGSTPKNTSGGAKKKTPY
jgi:hypothetical protein